MAEALRVPAGPKIREWSRKQGFSDWMVARWARILQDGGMQGELSHFLEGIKRRPPRYLRVNTLKLERDEVAKRLASRGFVTAKAPMDPDVLRLVQAPISPGATMEHMMGMTTPQDLASAAAVLALRPGRGDVVADLAAAPGVKTLHIAARMQDHGSIVACEPDEARMRGLRFNLERCGVTSAVLRPQRAQDLPGAGWADKVLLDAPCTGEGTIPKDSDRRRGHIEEIDRLAAEQRDIVDAADRILKPGGALVYATCTFAPEENEMQVQRLVERGYSIESTGLDACGAPLGQGLPRWGDQEFDASMRQARRFYPGIHPTLGFFVARLRKGGA